MSAAASVVLPLTVFCLTAARDLTLGDSAEFVAVAKTLGIAHPPGYPLYTVLSALAVRFPAGSPFFRLSMLSAVFGALAAGVVSLLVWELVSGGQTGGDRREAGRLARALGSVTGGLAFATAPVVWSQSTVPEVYSLSALLVFASLYLFVRWRRLSEAGLLPDGVKGERLLWAGGLLLGLSLAHHLTAALVVPSVVVALSAGREGHARSGSVGRMLLFVALGVSVYAYLPLRSAQDPAMLWSNVSTLPGLLSHVSGAQYASRLFAESMPGILAKLGSFLSGLPRELGWPLLSLSGVGLCVLWARSKRLLVVLVLELVLVVAHAVNYRIPDVGSYYIPVHGVLAAAAGLAVCDLPRFVTAGGRARTAVALALACVAFVSLGLRTASDWPERDLSANRGGRVYLQRLLREVPDGAIVVAQNDRTIFPLWYARFVEGQRSDVAIINIRERAPHLEAWYEGVRFPTEEGLAVFMGRDPSVPCVPPALETLPVSSYLQLFVSLNEGARPIVADIDVGREVFPDRSFVTGLLVGVVNEGVAALVERAPGVRVLESYARGPDDGTRDAYATSLADLGQLMLVRGQPAAGIRILELARDVEPDATHIRNNLGVAYREAGRMADAYRELRRALDLAPGSAATYHNLAMLYLADGDAPSAIETLEKAVRFDPSNLRYKLELSSLLEKEGDLERAESALRWVERNAGDDLPARLAYGDFLLRHERYTEAVAAYRRAEESTPLAAGVFTSLSRCFWEMEDLDAAIAAMRRSVELQPRNPRLKYDLALMLSRNGMKEEAIACLDDVASILPSAWQPIGLKASILADMGLADEARPLFERARELGAGGDQFLGAWSRMEIAAGDTAAAARIMESESH